MAETWGGQRWLLEHSVGRKYSPRFADAIRAALARLDVVEAERDRLKQELQSTRQGWRVEQATTQE